MTAFYSSSSSLSALARPTVSQPLLVQEDSVKARLMDICSEKYQTVSKTILDEVTQIFLSHRDTITAPGTGESGEKQNSPFCDAFIEAVMQGSVALVERMQQLVSTKDIMLDIQGWTPFHHLTTLSEDEFSSEHTAVLRFLFDQFPEDLFSENDSFTYPIFMACQGNRFRFLRELTKLYANDSQFVIQVLRGLSIISSEFWTSDHEQLLQEIAAIIAKNNPKLFSEPTTVQRSYLEQSYSLECPLMMQAYINGNRVLIQTLEKLGYASYDTEKDSYARNILQRLCSLLPSETSLEHCSLFINLMRSHFALFEQSLSTVDSVPYNILRFGNKPFLEAFREYFPDKRDQFFDYFAHPAKTVYPVHDFFRGNSSFIQAQSKLCTDIVRHQKATLTYLCEVCSPRILDKVKDSQNATAFSYAFKNDLFYLVPDGYYKNPDSAICFRLLMNISQAELKAYLTKFSQATTLMRKIEELRQDSRVQNAATPLEQYQRAFFIHNFLPLSEQNITRLVNYLSEKPVESFARFLLETIDFTLAQGANKKVAQVLSLWRSLIIQAYEKDKPAVRKGLRAVIVTVIKIPELVHKNFDFARQQYGGFRFFLPSQRGQDLVLMDQEFLKGGSIKQFSLSYQCTIESRQVAKISLIAAQQMRTDFYQALTAANLKSMITNIETLSKCSSIQQTYRVHHIPKRELIIFSECYATDLYEVLKNETLFASSPCTSPKDFVQALVIIRDVFRALEYMHRQMKIHWDVKPENVFLQKKGIYRATVGDLDFVQEVTVQGDLKEKRQPISYSLYGTLGYSSPQLRLLSVSPQATSTQSTQTPPPGGYMAHDIWAAAMLFGELFTMHVLKDQVILTESNHQTMVTAMKTQFDKVQTAQVMVENKYKPLVGQCCGLFAHLAAFEPEARCSFSDALKVINRILPQAYKNLPSEQDKVLFAHALNT